jgi:flavodoxin
MKTLIIYYSRDGHTKAIAEAAAKILHADIEEIKEIKSRKGIIAWLLAGRDACMKKPTEISSSYIDPAKYDLIIISTPIWAFTMTPAIRAWLNKHGRSLKKVAFIATMGGNGDKRAFKHMEELCGKPPVATATFIDKKIAKDEYKNELDAFLKQLHEKL